MPAPRLRAYPTYTVIAEKLHAIALLGMTNSRLKDYFDLSVLLERETLDTDLLAQAIKAMFERSGMAVPEGLPVGRTDEFAHDASRPSPLSVAFSMRTLHGDHDDYSTLCALLPPLRTPPTGSRPVWGVGRLDDLVD